MQLLVREFVSTPAHWDKFAQEAGASFRCAYRATRAWQFEHHLFHRIQRLEVIAQGPDGGVKIAQCAVGLGSRWRVFADGLQLLPSNASDWCAVMQAVMDHLGPGHYIYGSPWSLERCRADQFDMIQGVKITDIESSNLEFIDFTDWSSWEHYYSQVSKNVRRNVARSERTGGAAHINYGGKLLQLIRLQKLKYITLKRKNISGSFMGRLFRSIYRIFTLFEFTDLASYQSSEGTLAVYGEIRFGLNTFYLEGGSRKQNNGAAWHLLMVMIERAWRESQGRGAFVMGSDDRSQAGSKAWDGLAQSRRQCRAKSLPISVVRFAFTGEQRQV